MTSQQENERKGGLRDDIIDWDNKHPIDFLWRRKYNVLFGSEEHLRMDFVTMLYQLIENYEVQKAQQTDVDKDEFFMEEGYVKMSQDEVDDEFDKIDLDEENEKLKHTKKQDGDTT